MDIERIKAACNDAVSLSSCVTDETLRAEAFGVILQHILGTPHRADVARDSHKSVQPLNSRPKRKAGLKSRLEELIENNFFGEPRSVSDVAEALKTAGWNHKSKEISSRLMDLTRAKRVRRNTSPDGLRYSNW